MPTYRITQGFSPGGVGPAQFTVRFNSPGSLTTGEQQSMVDAWTSEMNTHVPALYCADVAWTGAVIAEYERVQDPVSLKWYFRDVTIPLNTGVALIAGGIAGHSSPPQIAVVVSLGTLLAGRRHRGRVYTPPPPELVTDGAGSVTDHVARKDMIQQSCEAVEAAIIPVSTNHIVHSVTYGDETAVSTYSSNGQADTQRRRARD